MKIKLCCFPGVTWTWKEFLENTSPGSIALDGFVDCQTMMDFDQLKFNFDHHAHCVRAATLSTSAQIYDQIGVGFMDCLKQFETVSVYVNDPDEDVCLAVWLLRNYARFEGVKSEPAISRFLWLSDKLDVYGGAYPMNLDDSLLRQRKWVNTPYRELRMSGALTSAQASVLENTIDAVGLRITKLSLGQAEELALDTHHEILRSFPTWKLIREIGAEARQHLYMQGMKAFVAYMGEINGRHKYSIGRVSEMVPFPLPMIFEALNAQDRIASDASDRWGGSSIIGGSPRLKGSGLGPDELAHVINVALVPVLV